MQFGQSASATSTAVCRSACRSSARWALRLARACRLDRGRNRICRPERLSQECDLACVIKAVLRYADELRIGCVGRLGNQRLVESLRREVSDGPPQVGVELLERAYR